MSAVFPSKAMDLPKESPEAPSDAVSFFVSVHVESSVPVRVKTYTEPDSEPLSSSPVAPMSAVFPSKAMDVPKESP